MESTVQSACQQVLRQQQVEFQLVLREQQAAAQAAIEEQRTAMQMALEQQREAMRLQMEGQIRRAVAEAVEWTSMQFRDSQADHDHDDQIAGHSGTGAGRPERMSRPANRQPRPPTEPGQAPTEIGKERTMEMMVRDLEANPVQVEEVNNFGSMLRENSRVYSFLGALLEYLYPSEEERFRISLTKKPGRVMMDMDTRFLMERMLLLHLKRYPDSWRSKKDGSLPGH